MSSGLILGYITLYLILIPATLYAYHVRDHHPDRYWGIWRLLSGYGRERRDTLKFIAGMMCGTLIGFLITSAYGPHSTGPLHDFAHRYPILPPLALAAAIVFTIIYYRKRRKQT